MFWQSFHQEQYFVAAGNVITAAINDSGYACLTLLCAMQISRLSVPLSHSLEAQPPNSTFQIQILVLATLRCTA